MRGRSGCLQPGASWLESEIRSYPIYSIDLPGFGYPKPGRREFWMYDSYHFCTHNERYATMSRREHLPQCLNFPLGPEPGIPL
jgi:hypothetical protein